MNVNTPSGVYRIVKRCDLSQSNMNSRSSTCRAFISRFCYKIQILQVKICCAYLVYFIVTFMFKCVLPQNTLSENYY